MQTVRLTRFMLTLALMAVPAGCKNAAPEHPRTYEQPGEEPDVRLGVADTLDMARGPVRLVLRYDKDRSAFVASVENLSNQRIPCVRVEVHLSNGVELGPTPALALPPAGHASIELAAPGQSFSWWKAHAETSARGAEHYEEHHHDDDSPHSQDHRRQHH